MDDWSVFSPSIHRLNVRACVTGAGCVWLQIGVSGRDRGAGGQSGTLASGSAVSSLFVA